MTHDMQWYASHLGRASLFLVVALPIWWMGYKGHQAWSSTIGDAVRLPRWLALLLGSGRPDGGVIVRATLLQLLAWMIAIPYELAVFEFITFSTVTTWLFWPLAGWSVLVIVLYLIAKPRERSQRQHRK